MRLFSCRENQSSLGSSWVQPIGRRGARRSHRVLQQHLCAEDEKFRSTLRHQRPAGTGLRLGLSSRRKVPKRKLCSSCCSWASLLLSPGRCATFVPVPLCPGSAPVSETSLSETLNLRVPAQEFFGEPHTKLLHLQDQQQSIQGEGRFTGFKTKCKWTSLKLSLSVCLCVCRSFRTSTVWSGRAVLAESEPSPWTQMWPCHQQPATRPVRERVQKMAAAKMCCSRGFRTSSPRDRADKKKKKKKIMRVFVWTSLNVNPSP